MIFQARKAVCPSFIQDPYGPRVAIDAYVVFISGKGKERREVALCLRNRLALFPDDMDSLCFWFVGEERF